MKRLKKSIVLIGFMGVGKTTIGKELAVKLQCGFIDIDAEIESKFGMSPVEIFKTYGESVFRKTEKEMIIEESKQKEKVISVGGGAFMQEEIRNACMENAIVIFLDMTWEHWKNRLSLLIPSRPMLHGKTEEEIKELFKERQAIYQNHHIRININGLGVAGAVEAIYDELRLKQLL